MGKTLIESNTTATAGQPVGAETLTFIQEAWNDPITAIFKSLIGTYTTNDVVIVQGCEVTTGNPTGAGAVVINAGVVYRNGVWYEVPAFSGTNTGSNVVVGTLTTSDAVGPVTFTDGNSYSIHQVVKVVLSSAASGSGTFDFSTFKRLNNGRSFLSATLASQTISSGTYVDLTGLSLTTPNDGRTRMYLILFKNWVSQDNSATIAYLDIQIYNNTTATSLDLISVGKTIASVTGDIPQSGVCVYFGAIAPNNVIKMQAKRTTANCTVTECKFYMVEIF